MTIDTKKLAELEGVDAEGLDEPAESAAPEQAAPAPAPPPRRPPAEQCIPLGGGAFFRSYGGGYCGSITPAPRKVGR